MRASTSASHACGSTSIHFGRDDETVHRRRALSAAIGKGLIIPWFRQRKLSSGIRFIP